MTKRLSTDPYKGVRDFYPEEYFIQEYILNTMSEVAERYGYVRYDASILEPTELYEAKTGEEIVTEQAYTFEDRGGRQVTLRPEMTPTLARMVAKKKRELTFPARWYSIPNVFRYERPQRGRLREHWQLNVDIFGVGERWCDVENIVVAYEILKAFGLSDNQFEVRINDRKLVNETLSNAGLNDDQAHKMQKLLDRKEKMEKSDFEAKSKEIAGPDFVFDPKISAELKALLGDLERAGIKNAVFSPNLMRGFDYYTGTVFEIFDTNPENNRSLFGGGRYDDLLEIFGQEKVPFVGFGMGDVTMRDVLETYGLLPLYSPTTQLCVCYANTEKKNEIDAVVRELRKNEVNVITANPSKKIGDQIGYADKLGVPYVLCIGSQELETNSFTIKELATGKEATRARETLANFFK